MADYLAAETGDLLDAENGDNLILEDAGASQQPPRTVHYDRLRRVA